MCRYKHLPKGRAWSIQSPHRNPITANTPLTPGVSGEKRCAPPGDAAFNTCKPRNSTVPILGMMGATGRTTPLTAGLSRVSGMKAVNRGRIIGGGGGGGGWGYKRQMVHGPSNLSETPEVPHRPAIVGTKQTTAST
jgi:hypothetical protein